MATISRLESVYFHVRRIHKNNSFNGFVSFFYFAANVMLYLSKWRNIISHVSAKIIGLPTPMLSEIIDHAIFKRARAVATESDHPLSTFFHVLPSRRRYRCIKCKTSRYSRSFVPVAIRMLNAK